MKTFALAGIFLVLVTLGVAYNWAHRSAGGSSGGAAALADSVASGQAQAGWAHESPRGGLDGSSVQSAGPVSAAGAGCGFVCRRQCVRDQVWAGAIRLHVPGTAVD